ncbi:YihY/virulence factor BrkB family protein [Fodinibius sediminis]|uniref:Membrane protein n=1 Tax=Fodinibius sediminis TaxID=1214077 RepID=A0A521B0B1_9BACT|nr:YihY/virulence factor BrkB family protein [Fodinibius sediminis]SMO40451.1 membrane protein [Fodinibius sediminis]
MQLLGDLIAGNTERLILKMKMTVTQTIKWYRDLLVESYKELKANDPLRLSSSTAFFAMFSIIPMIVLLLDVTSTIFSVGLLRQEIFKTLQQMFGTRAADYLSSILENVQNLQDGPLVTSGIIVFLTFIVTTLFHVIHNSFNEILKVKLTSSSLLFFLKSRGFFLIIIFCGSVLFLATFIIDVALSFAGNRLFDFATINPLLISTLDMLFSMAVFSVWLAIIYKYLPEVKFPWKPVWVGSLFTTILSLFGQFILGKIMLSGSLSNIYGPSASIVLILLFIFYLSFILYYGLCLAKKYAEMENYELRSTEVAVKYELRELE